jgi:hypothetical protein
MARFVDWQKILTQYGVDWIDHGANVKYGNTNVKCPFCADDPSQHMGLDTKTGYWACWRNSNQRGKNPARLLSKLLRISLARANEILGIQPIDTTDLADALQTLRGLHTDRVSRPVLTFPSEFKPLDTISYSAEPFLSYVRSRQFDNPVRAAAQLGLQFAYSGAYSGRVIFPYYQDGSLVHWTGRSIYPGATLRYKACPSDTALDPYCIYGFDSAMNGGEVLVVVEGPVDAAKIQYYGSRFGVCAVAASTSTPNPHQVDQINLLSNLFTSVIIMLDRGELLRASAIVGSFIRSVHVSEPPFGVKDFGELSAKQSLVACRQLSQGEVFR